MVATAAVLLPWPSFSFLAHQDGIVDADYVARSGDRRYAVGQRLVVTAAEVRRLALLTERLAAELV